MGTITFKTLRDSLGHNEPLLERPVKMSEPENKRAKTDSPAYELIYWPGLPGRGEFVRLVFEATGTPYADRSQDRSPKEAAELVMSYNNDDSIPGPANPPVLAPPVLRHGDLVLHQTPNILQYLATRLGLASKEGNEIFHLNQIALTLMDGFVAEIHDTHHPIAVELAYEDQKPEAKKRADNFKKSRLPKFLGYAERVIASKASGEGPWMYGGKMTYVDLVLFQTVDGTSFAFPKTMEKLKKSGDYDNVFKLYDAVKEVPNIKDYLASDRRQKYGNGIWRHYPEFEEA